MCVHTYIHTHLHLCLFLQLFLYLYSEKQEFILIPPILAQNYRVHSGFFPFIFFFLSLSSPTIRNLTPIIFNKFIYLLSSLVCSPSPILPGHCPTQMPSCVDFDPCGAIQGTPPWIAPLYCFWAAFPSCLPSSLPGTWLPLGCRKEGLIFKYWQVIQV